MPAISQIIIWIAGFFFADSFLGRIEDLTSGNKTYSNNGSSSVSGEKPPAPSVGEIAKDAVNTPSSVWGLAALGFVAVFLIAQLRAAGSEVAAGTRGVYKEAQVTTQSLAKPNTSLKGT
jgi:hypothetical protein